MTPAQADAEYAKFAATKAVTNYEQMVVQDTNKLFQELQLQRAVFASQWEEAAALIWPTSKNTFFYGNYNWQGMKKTEQQIDSTGMLALTRFTAILDSMITPRNMFWQQIAGEDDYVMKDRATRLFFDDVTKRLFNARYADTANFMSQNQGVYTHLGAFGNGAMLTEMYFAQGTGVRGLRYTNIPLGELFFHQNFQGVIDGFIRWYRMTPRQAVQKFGKDRLPPVLLAALEQHSEWTYNFLHRVSPRDDFQPGAMGKKGMPFISHHICVEGQCLMAPPGGYRGLPITISRYLQTPMEVYGRGVAQLVLPSLKTLNAEKRTFLKTGHRAADPVLLVGDDGLVETVNLLPGAVNKGGMSPDGKPMIGVLPSGNIQITKEMMDEERNLINDGFLISLFQIMTETPQMSATEVIERVNEKGILLAPTVGRQHSEYIGPMTERELDLMAYLHKLPPMPPRLREAGGRYKMVDCSPMARAMRAQSAAGFQRMVEFTNTIVQITGDTSLYHTFNFKTAMPEIATQVQGVPERWINDEQTIAKLDQAMAQAQAKQQQIQALPAQAAMVKAQAVVAKNGGGQPQQGQPGPQDQGQGQPDQSQQQPGGVGQ
jgi:hypothetical protein